MTATVTADAVAEAYHQCREATELLGGLVLDAGGTRASSEKALREALSATRAAVAAVRFALVADHDRT
ncbi:hypothetical protein [Amycolatopsis eburnea]|uniref:Uncharacterized protein n=1 Tax=Amycolatopsis eburnea TaxID=2267691 RepID=A0A427T8L2_9PSEU|nr:hypothetical protein [Amycolatopsis eburnea]RSD17101.1 hypothetical protein EIY87_20055 [Amycolatopsis eburnea]